MNKNNNTYSSKQIDPINRTCEELFNVFGELFIAYGVGIVDVFKFIVRKWKISIPLIIIVNLIIHLLILRKLHVYVLSFEFSTLFQYLMKKKWPFDDLIKNQLLLLIPVCNITFFLVGIISRYKRSRIERIFRLAGLKNPDGNYPAVVDEVSLNTFNRNLYIDPKGLGISDFEGKLDRLEGLFRFGKIINLKRNPKNQGHLILEFSKEVLPTCIRSIDIANVYLKPNHFLIGKSLGGYITQDISELPHLLIAGMTGSGKSVFFKQTLYGRLKSTPNIESILSDLKGGLERSDFKTSPKVKVVKDITNAVRVLRDARNEMLKRFEYLEKNEFKKVVPERDNLKRIVIGIDECSVLYMKKSKGGKHYNEIIEAKDITDDIAKLSRAASIHLILATQKVVKETIDTNIQDNISGKVCFKVESNPASILVLGNNMATNLPQIRGRAIWHYGQEYVEFQSPYIEESEIKSFCSSSKELIKKDSKRKNESYQLEQNTIKTNSKIDKFMSEI